MLTEEYWRRVDKAIQELLDLHFGKKGKRRKDAKREKKNDESSKKHCDVTTREFALDSSQFSGSSS